MDRGKKRQVPTPSSLSHAEHSLAALYDLAWTDQGERMLFHKEPVWRDEYKMKDVKVRKHTNSLKANETSGVVVDVDLDSQYNPFKTNAGRPAEVDGTIVSGGPSIVYILPLCFLAHKPVVWRTHAKNVLAFVEEGVYSIPLDERLPPHVPEDAVIPSNYNPSCKLPDMNLLTQLLVLQDMNVYTDEANESMLEHVYCLTVIGLLPQCNMREAQPGPVLVGRRPFRQQLLVFREHVGFFSDVAIINFYLCKAFD
ncbi:uncharacterized protein FOMMEDRAFT_160220 [Fomitiporia mediterranea MF3/22]|uniref:uncharacterized protein n=1 Tax=Fomitiporia mediterranea (strain MF3/22) TaxID=694068 RepID=UPI00044085ED|nr:uncharacterized protein FOMMEDRAFT_160220 [Fomitiporia mediterranea MF3/22]EJC99779.1 hypothetical protein FOMMEDRAFT_160220 [Fomitiporia mediterranea MF3/22]